MWILEGTGRRQFKPISLTLLFFLVILMAHNLSTSTPFPPGSLLLVTGLKDTLIDSR